MTTKIGNEVLEGLVGVMVKNGEFHIYPSKSEGEYFDQSVEELIIDEEGSVFALFVNDSEPIMVPNMVR